MRTIRALALVPGLLMCAVQQISAQSRSTPPVLSEPTPATNDQVLQSTRAIVSGYVLGSGDQISIRVVNFEEISDKPVAIDLSGCIHLPMIGQIPVSGLTIEQVGSEIAKRLEAYVIHPDVSVSITDFRSQPVSVVG